MPPECASCGLLHSPYALCESVAAYARAEPRHGRPCSNCGLSHLRNEACQDALTLAENRRRMAEKMAARRDALVAEVAPPDRSAQRLDAGIRLDRALALMAREPHKEFVRRQAALDLQIDNALRAPRGNQ